MSRLFNIHKYLRSPGYRMRGCNDNQASAEPTEEQLYAERIRTLCCAWGLSEVDSNKFRRAIYYFQQSAIKAAANMASKRVVHTVPDSRRLYIAGALGLLRAAFSMIRAMDMEDGKAMLEEVSRETDHTIRNLTGDKDYGKKRV
jgi:hypothetical protein